MIFHPREGAVAKPEWYEDDVFIKRIVATAVHTFNFAGSACTILFELLSLSGAGTQGSVSVLRYCLVALPRCQSRGCVCWDACVEYMCRI